MWKLLVSSFVVLQFAAHRPRAFPQGGPAESCDSMLPRHVYTAPRPAHESPYTFVASSSHYSYQNVDGIQVELGGAAFKGFFIAAIDPATSRRIGTFLRVKGTHPVKCSAVTHNDNQPKSHVSLLWLPPDNVPEGNVVFMATVVNSYSRYYTGLIASVPAAGYAAKKK
ncbi:uncharacterized protein LOC135368266 [Ornithodoros turicata]|uniref:uncharacterized protein LOC135368266 n=1 Tax=Ornithodoros turicata TaxID=34597 RepID=UPI00313A1056